MSTWTLLILMCVPGESCHMGEIPEYPSEAACEAAIPSVLTILNHGYIATWMERTGTTPPPAQVAAACREDKPI